MDEPHFELPGPEGWAAHHENAQMEFYKQQGATHRLTAKLVCGVLVATLIATAWACRWQTVKLPAGDGPAGALLMNRWTGEMRYVQGNAWLTVKSAD